MSGQLVTATPPRSTPTQPPWRTKQPSWMATRRPWPTTQRSWTATRRSSRTTRTGWVESSENWIAWLDISTITKSAFRCWRNAGDRALNLPPHSDTPHCLFLASKQPLGNGGDQVVDQFDLRVRQFIAVGSAHTAQRLVQRAPTVRVWRGERIAGENISKRPEAPAVAPCLDETLKRIQQLLVGRNGCHRRLRLRR